MKEKLRIESLYGKNYETLHRIAMITYLIHKNECFGDLVYLGDFAIRYDATKVAMDSVQMFLSAPDHFIDSGGKIRSAWKNKAIDKSIVKVGNEIFFAKRYNCLGEIYKIKNICRESNAYKAWRAGWKFLQSGISTPRPIICIEERRFRLLGRSYLLCEFINNTCNLLDAWSALDEQHRLRFLYLAGTEIGNMHHMGCLHGDLNWRNVLIRKKSNTEKIFLVDLDGCRFSKHIDEKTARRDLGHFYRDLERNKASVENIDIFQQGWRKTFRQGI